MFVLLGLHALLTALGPLLGRRLGRRAFDVVLLAPAATLAWLLARAPEVLRGEEITERLPWVPGLGVTLDLRLDGFGLVMALLVSGVGALVLLYSRSYFDPRPGLGRFAGTLTAFAGSMLGLVLADNVLFLFVFWELTSITSFLLIGFEDEKGSARAAALQALLVTAAGGLALLGGLVLLGQAAGTYSLSGMLAARPEGPVVTAALVLALLGAFTKSAQVPFHAWLPGAMAAPTPVSAYLHSATMVKAGVYLIARLAPAFSDVPIWYPLVVGIGLTTMLVGGYRALRQNDLKLLLAYGTVSQLGFMTILVGAGRPELAFAGTAVILAHAAFKASLFLVVGIVDHQAHSRDLRLLTGLGRSMPATLATGALAAASMAALPPFLGFVAKEAALEALLHEAGAVVTAGVVVGSILTVAYTARFLWGAFADKPARPGGHDMIGPEVPRPSGAFLAPAAFLALVGLVLGVAPQGATPLVDAGAASLNAAASGSLALWHGPTPALTLSAIAIGVGLVLFLTRVRVARWQREGEALTGLPPGAESTYRASVAGLNRLADRVTGVVQNGSLPVYIGVILATVLALPGGALLLRTAFTGDLVPAESLLQGVVALLTVTAAVAALLAGHRFAAVLALGAVGYGVAILFVMQGAPDLALTQLLVETLTMVIFVLVLARLPIRFRPLRWPLGQGLRVAVALGVGVFVTLFSLIAASVRTAEPVSAHYLEASLSEAGGRNVVNVILVDFRAFDTLGEITVLTVAALGLIGLVTVARRREEER